jgi:rare lipoprotein A
LPTGTTSVTVYKPGVATYFGHGFYGSHMACGAVLRHTTLGVAHRTLPCGTLVDLYYKGRSIAVPVIDRGPFRHGTTWDLTEATAKALKMASTSKIGAVRAPD